MNWEITTFIAYFVILLGVALVFYFNGTNKNSEELLPRRALHGPLGHRLVRAGVRYVRVAADGLPGSILAFGFGQMWIGIGLAIGTAANWILCAKRLRTFSKAANDSITLPQYLTNRFAVDSRALQLVCALIFLFAYDLCGLRAGGGHLRVYHALPGYFPEDRHVRLPAHHRGLYLFGGFAAVLDGFLPGPSDDGGADAGAYRRLFRPQRAARSHGTGDGL